MSSWPYVLIISMLLSIILYWWMVNSRVIYMKYIKDRYHSFTIHQKSYSSKFVSCRILQTSEVPKPQKSLAYLFWNLLWCSQPQTKCYAFEIEIWDFQCHLLHLMKLIICNVSPSGSGFFSFWITLIDESKKKKKKIVRYLFRVWFIFCLIETVHVEKKILVFNCSMKTGGNVKYQLRCQYALNRYTVYCIAQITR